MPPVDRGEIHAEIVAGVADRVSGGTRTADTVAADNTGGDVAVAAEIDSTADTAAAEDRSYSSPAVAVGSCLVR